MINNPTDSAIINLNNPPYPKVGVLNVDVVPHDESGNDYEEVPENPDEIVGTSIFFTVSIKEIKDLPANFCEQIFVEYEAFYNGQRNTTKIVKKIYLSLVWTQPKRKVSVLRYERALRAPYRLHNPRGYQPY